MVAGAAAAQQAAVAVLRLTASAQKSMVWLRIISNWQIYVTGVNTKSLYGHMCALHLQNPAQTYENVSAAGRTAKMLNITRNARKRVKNALRTH